MKSKYRYKVSTVRYKSGQKVVAFDCTKKFTSLPQAILYVLKCRKRSPKTVFYCYRDIK